MARISKNQLIKLQKKYKTDESIAALFGITRQAVHQLRTGYGIAPVAEKHSERDNELARLYAEGMTGTRLTQKFSLSLSQVYRIVTRREVGRSRTASRQRP
jgi:hypothetical protein